LYNFLLQILTISQVLSQPYYQRVSNTAWLHHVITLYPRGVYDTYYCTLRDWFWGIAPPPIAECMYKMEICFRPTSSTDACKSAANLSEAAVSNIYTNRNNIPEFNRTCLEFWRYKVLPETFPVHGSTVERRVYQHFLWLNDTVNI